MQDAPSDNDPDANNLLAMDEDDFDNFFELLSKRRANRVSSGNEDLDEVLEKFSALFDTPRRISYGCRGVRRGSHRPKR